MRSLEQKPPSGSELERPELIDQPNDRRLFALLHALRNGAQPVDLAARCGIDRWFIDRLESITRLEKEGDVRELRRAGFSDTMIGALRGETVERSAPTFKLVDTCAAEFEAATPYYYSCWEEETESEPVEARSALVVGSGPIRIGQGIEFDYCSVHAAWSLREAGVRAVLVNSNPETVSTDFDTSDRLYFNPLAIDGAVQVAEAERVVGVLVQFGGQTAINLAEPLEERGVRVMGSAVEAIDLAEDRRAVAAGLDWNGVSPAGGGDAMAAARDAIGIPQPVGGTTTSVEEAVLIAERAGYPVLVRPSYVLGGRAME